MNPIYGPKNDAHHNLKYFFSFCYTLTPINLLFYIRYYKGSKNNDNQDVCWYYVSPLVFLARAIFLPYSFYT